MKRELTETSKTLFKDLAEDAGNWNGVPLLGGNVGMSKELRGNVTDLKKAGLIRTQAEEGNVWVFFTEAGIEYAKTLGVNLEWIR